MDFFDFNKLNMSCESHENNENHENYETDKSRESEERSDSSNDGENDDIDKIDENDKEGLLKEKRQTVERIDELGFSIEELLAIADPTDEERCKLKELNLELEKGVRRRSKIQKKLKREDVLESVAKYTTEKKVNEELRILGTDISTKERELATLEFTAGPGDQDQLRSLSEQLGFMNECKNAMLRRKKQIKDDKFLETAIFPYDE